MRKGKPGCVQRTQGKEETLEGQGGKIMCGKNGEKIGEREMRSVNRRNEDQSDHAGGAKERPTSRSVYATLGTLR